MSIIDHARKRIVAVLHEIERLKESDFPYSFSREAVALLQQTFNSQKSVLDKVFPDTTPSVAQIECGASLHLIFLYLPFLGFLLRSTNVRNGFETYFPLLRLARIILSSNTKLIISSEWDFSPFVYRSIPALPEFVLIGLPAHESGNPLLTPLAGHELGHSVWKTYNHSKQFEPIIDKHVVEELLTERHWNNYQKIYPGIKKNDIKAGTDLFTSNTWINAYNWALMQTEEIFCDIIGLRLFAESYLHAFAYLISPGRPGRRSLRYPNNRRRASLLMEAAKALDVEVEPNFASDFKDGDEPDEPATKLLVSIADDVSKALMPDLVKLTQNFADNKAVPKRDRDKVKNIRNEFQNWVAPTAKQASLSDILNAGWECALDENLWSNVHQIKPEDRNRVLRDLILKSMEVTEIYERLKQTT
ncbi:MAG: hypothetical protein AB1656_16060 [Candidatus Omnitrophota bacterium]